MTVNIPQTSRRDRSLVAISGTTTLACRRYATCAYGLHTYGMQTGGIMAFSTELCIPNGIRIKAIKRYLHNFFIGSEVETSLHHGIIRSLDYALDNSEMGLVIGRNEAIHNE